MRALFVCFGKVGRKIATILPRERSRFPGLKPLRDLVTVGIVTRKSGALVSSSGVDLEGALEEMETHGCFNDNARHSCRITAEEAVSSLDCDVMLELSILSIGNKGEPAVSHVRTALKRGCPSSWPLNRPPLPGKISLRDDCHGGRPGFQPLPIMPQGLCSGIGRRNTELDDQLYPWKDRGRGGVRPSGA